MEKPEQKNILAAYNVADENGKKMLCALFPDVFNKTKETIDNRPVTERIKTFEDAIAALGENHPNVIAYNCMVDVDEYDEPDILAYMKMRIVAAALNEGWTPDWGNKNERKWYPWFYILTEEEYNDLDDDAKCRVVGRASNNANAYGGLVYSVAYGVSAYSSSGNGSRLAFKSKELAEYAGKQFGELWATFLIG